MIAAIERTESFLKNRYGKALKYIWKSDVKKFFDNVNHRILLKIISFRIKNITTLNLLKEVIDSYTTVTGRRIGMPIGNLTSQIFANIYLNELDRFVKHTLKIGAYLRYGDDFIISGSDLKKLNFIKTQAVNFLNNELKLQVNLKSDKIVKPRHGLKFLGMKIWHSGKTLSKRNLARIKERLKLSNISSYSGIMKSQANHKHIKRFNWLVAEKILTDFSTMFDYGFDAGLV